MDRSNSKYDKARCFFVDDLGHHYDSTQPSRLELMLNDKNLKLTPYQLDRAKNIIKLLIDNKLTKYNDQAVKSITLAGGACVLVVEQAKNDFAALKSGGNDKSFVNMLNRAIKDNPDANIIVKIHPDTLDGKRGGITQSYYGDNLRGHQNIYKVNEKVNPFCLIEMCSKVYCFSSMLGFESLLLGKETHIFGLPCYAGWGLTVDYQKCARRTNKRSLEELVYIIYALYTHYIDENGHWCEVEDTIKELIKLRDEYFKEHFSFS
jgi:capsular polysaccharide export protein